MMKTATAHDFDRRAEQYERHATVQREAAAWLAEWLPEKIEGPALELGSGTGLFTRHLVGRAQTLIASDAAPRMVAAGVSALPDAEWSVADAGQPPGPRGYRWIFSCSLVQWLPDPLEVFRSWHIASTPGARLVSGWFISGTLKEFLAACPEASPFVWRDDAEWCNLLAEAGWNVQRHETKTIVRRYADSAAMLREVHNAGAIVPRRLGTGKLRQALRQYDRSHRGEEGVVATFQFLRVEAVRS
jgi:malonyl-CoA O-methyltransferase